MTSIRFHEDGNKFAILHDSFGAPVLRYNNHELLTALAHVENLPTILRERLEAYALRKGYLLLVKGMFIRSSSRIVGAYYIGDVSEQCS